MVDFKKGDRVVRVRGDEHVGEKYGVVRGCEYVVEDLPLHGLRLEGNIYTWDSSNFELVKPKPTFDLKSEKWFIRFNAEHKDLVVKWLNDNGVFEKLIPQIYKNTVGTGLWYFCSHVYAKDGEWEHLSRHQMIENGFKEVKMTFETVIKEVVYPKSDKEIRVEELMKIIQDAKSELNELYK